VFTLTRKQIKHFEHVMLSVFGRGLRAHSAEHFPTHWRVIGATQMEQVVQFGIRRALESGYRSERDGYMFHSLMLQLGSYFDTDPQYPWLAKALLDDTLGSRSERLANAYDAAIDYLDRVAGAQGQHMRAAVHRLRWTVMPELREAPRGHFDDLLNLLEVTWPQKLALIGGQTLRSLAESVIPIAKAGGLTTFGGACLYTIACFIFGHGLHHDPQFSWARQSLSLGLSGEPAMNAFAQSLEVQLAALD